MSGGAVISNPSACSLLSNWSAVVESCSATVRSMVRHGTRTDSTTTCTALPVSSRRYAVRRLEYRSRIRSAATCSLSESTSPPRCSWICVVYTSVVASKSTRGTAVRSAAATAARCRAPTAAVLHPLDVALSQLHERQIRRRQTSGAVVSSVLDDGRQRISPVLGQGVNVRLRQQGRREAEVCGEASTDHDGVDVDRSHGGGVHVGRPGEVTEIAGRNPPDLLHALGYVGRRHTAQVVEADLRVRRRGRCERRVAHVPQQSEA